MFSPSWGCPVPVCTSPDIHTTFHKMDFSERPAEPWVSVNGKWQQEEKNISLSPFFLYFLGLLGKTFQGLTINRDRNWSNCYPHPIRLWFNCTLYKQAREGDRKRAGRKEGRERGGEKGREGGREGGAERGRKNDRSSGSQLNIFISTWSYKERVK